MLDWNQCPTVERVPGKVSGMWLFKGSSSAWIEFEQILDVLAECFRWVIAAANFRASVVRWLP
jgi:hypothetical protein